MSCDCVPTHYGARAGQAWYKERPWWLSGGVDKSCCLAAYQADGRLGLEDTYENLAAPDNGLAIGTHDLTAPVAPTWTAADGWAFDGATQYLVTGISTADSADYSMICQFSDAGVANGLMIGFYNSGIGKGFVCTPNRNGNRRYMNNTDSLISGAATDGVQAVAGNHGYLDGIEDATIAAPVGMAVTDIYIGAVRLAAGGPASYYFAGNIQRLAIYDCVLTEAQVIAITNALIGDGAPGFTIVSIPDTQTLVSLAPVQVQEIADWIVDQADTLNIGMVLHEGDLVETVGNVGQWTAITDMLDTFDAAGIPYLFAIGNHDYDTAPPGMNRTVTVWNTYIPQARYTANDWWDGGFYEAGHSENAYCIVGDYLFMALEFGPRDAVLTWAGGIIAANPLKKVFIVTHSHEYIDGSLVIATDANAPTVYLADANNAGDVGGVWDQLISAYSNIYWVQSGHHVPNGSARHEGTGTNGNKVVNSFCNWQGSTIANVRVLKLYTHCKLVRARTYNPHSHLSSWNADNRFSVTYP